MIRCLHRPVPGVEAALESLKAIQVAEPKQESGGLCRKRGFLSPSLPEHDEDLRSTVEGPHLPESAWEISNRAIVQSRGAPEIRACLLGAWRYQPFQAVIALCTAST